MSVAIQQQQADRNTVVEPPQSNEVEAAQLYSIPTNHLEPPHQMTQGTRPMSNEAMFWEEFDMGDADIGSLGESTKELWMCMEAQLNVQLKQWGAWLGVGNEGKESDTVEGETGTGGLCEQEVELEELAMNLDTRDREAWSPYPSKTQFLLDVIDNLPWLHISGSMMKLILWLLCECEVDIGMPTVHWKLPQGNIFSFNDPQALIANDWSNPLNGVISEIWHASKWRNDMERHLLSPMYDDGNDNHYYINEPTMLKDGCFAIPVRWLESEEDGKIYADTWRIDFDGNSLATINDTHVVQIPASELQFSMPDLLELKQVPTWSPVMTATGHPQHIPNPDRKLAQGEPLYTSFIDIFGDNVSGNQSKSWNKHWNVYMTHQNLPCKLLQQQKHVHFVSTSPYASVPEQFQGIHEKIRSTHDQPVRVKRAITGDYIQVKIWCNCGPGDNPSQSEILAHIGGNGNLPCCKCHVRGTQKHKMSDTGFTDFFEPGSLHSGKENLRELEKQKKNPHIPTPHIQSILMRWVSNNCSLVYNNYLLSDDWDIAQDTPVELLHTVLLGVVNPDNKKKYTIQLQATNKTGLSVGSFQASYIMQYTNSLIGQQLKILVQVNIFHVYDLIDENVLALTRAIGELTALLWFPEIHHMDTYILDVQTAVANVLNIAASIDPSKIIKKIKYHLLCHLTEDIKWFGPLIGIMTKNYESFNSVFHASSILSNHCAPSRDIACQLAQQETVKHVLSGGHLYSQTTGKWKDSGSAAHNFMKTHPSLCSLLGWPELHEQPIPGNVCLKPQKVNNTTRQKEYPQLLWDVTQGTNTVNQCPEWSAESWYQCKSIISSYENVCSIGSWVFATSPLTPNAMVTGQIVEILCSINRQTDTLVLLDTFKITSECHVIFAMPVLTWPCGEQRIVIIPGKDLLFDYNMQHDCHAAKCQAIGQEPIRQEQAEMGATQDIIVHASLDQFIINTHSLHNAHLIHEVVPWDLIMPVPKYNADN
ncbi:hypothetical protein P691DRAFT_795296 [Macrolepiota fuliginosa MF-IS2]|uniref:Uncharacterized protein n=1 Tax=Macrolepiota fuliginosa MF-IS2 TaxID=1400762 RepID=A0A9P5X9X3_9AGAR|nr:hypothetical protein P691DRAFT_795296 [Macrolepiota fuliginosa MF-IS2]